ncbi:MAG: DUF4835 domain-containing protein [Bacteroidetes bacterium]|nr:MAG: DUF4835 domain-containing protein [Bacteroidota bacterium]
MPRTILVFSLLLTGLCLNAQEFRCNVSVVSPQVQGSNKQVFQTLQNAIYEFMNNRNWTDHVYAPEERIEVTMMFNITDQPSADEFKGTLQVQVRRPVFNTSLNTTTLNFIDNDLHFRYVEFSPLEFDLNTHQSSLTSLLAFYAYFILGIDYDTFSLKGGDPYFNNAERVVMNAQNANAPEVGWKPMDDLSHKSRYWLIKDMIDADYEGVREFNYRYHRLGLDVMDEKVAEGRAEVTNCLELLQEIYRKRPDPYMYLLKLVFDAKADELINIYSESYPEERTRAHNILTEIDKTNSSKYKAILEQS